MPNAEKQNKIYELHYLLPLLHSEVIQNHLKFQVIH